MLIDEVEVLFKAGHGGAGKVAFFPGQYSGPSGGNGGRGGDIYLRAVADLFVLNQFSKTKSVVAEDGQPGGNNKSSGRNGKDTIINLPVGSEIIDQKTKEKIDLLEVGQEILLACGGRGGLGNFELKSARNTTPKHAQKGLPGEEKLLQINLKLIADFGLIGLPSAGKSSVLNEITAASAKVANYPFTTLEPNLGAFEGKVIADIPGLIEGASGGKGLGIRFLKHIEKVSLLLHCVAADAEDTFQSYKVVRDELGKFSKSLPEKEEIILLTKTDLVDKKALEKKMKELKKTKRTIVPVSIYDYDSIENLKNILR